MAASTGLLIDLEGKISYGMAGVRGGHLRPTVSGFLTHGALAPRRARGARLSARDSDSDSSQAIISYVWRRMHLNFRKFPCWRLNAHSAGQEAGAFSAFEEDPAQVSGRERLIISSKASVDPPDFHLSTTSSAPVRFNACSGRTTSCVLSWHGSWPTAPKGSAAAIVDSESTWVRAARGASSATGISYLAKCSQLCPFVSPLRIILMTKRATPCSIPTLPGASVSPASSCASEPR